MDQQMDKNMTQLEIMEKLDQQALNKLYGQIKLNNLRAQLQDGQFKESENVMYARMHQLNQETLKYNKKKATFMYYLVTVNTPILELPSSDHAKFLFLQKQVNKFVNLKYVQAANHCYEYYGKKSNHVHAHILVYTANLIDDTSFRKRCKNTFKDCCNVNDPRIFNIKGISEERSREKYLYICGTKKEEKMPQVEKDISWLYSIGLEKNYITNTFHLPEE